MQILNSLKIPVLYQLEFQITLFQVYIQIPLVRGIYHLPPQEGQRATCLRWDAGVLLGGQHTWWQVTAASLPSSIAQLAPTNSLCNLFQENKRVPVS